MGHRTEDERELLMRFAMWMTSAETKYKHGYVPLESDPPTLRNLIAEFMAANESEWPVETQLRSARPSLAEKKGE